MHLRTVTFWTTIVILIAMFAMGAFYCLMLIYADIDSPTDMLNLIAFAGIPLLLHLLFLRSSKNSVSDVILLIAPVLYSVPMFVPLILIFGNNPDDFGTYFDLTYPGYVFIPIFWSLCILMPCWIVAYGVDVFFRVSRSRTADAPPPTDKKLGKEDGQNISGIPVALSCPICGKAPELLQSPERICFRCDGLITERLRAEHQLTTQYFETASDATVEWNAMVRRIKRNNSPMSYFQAVLQNAFAAPRTATIRTTAVLLLTLLALGLLYSQLHRDTVGFLAFIVALFATIPLIVNLSLLQFARNRVSEISLLVAAVLYCVPVAFLFIMIHREDLTTAGTVYPFLFVLLPMSGAGLVVPCWLIAVGAEIFFRITRSRTTASSPTLGRTDQSDPQA